MIEVLTLAEWIDWKFGFHQSTNDWHRDWIAIDDAVAVQVQNHAGWQELLHIETVSADSRTVNNGAARRLWRLRAWQGRIADGERQAEARTAMARALEDSEIVESRKAAIRQKLIKKGHSLSDINKAIEMAWRGENLLLTEKYFLPIAGQLKTLIIPGIKLLNASRELTKQVD